MTNSNQQGSGSDRGAFSNSGSTSSSTSQQGSQVHYNTSPIQVGNQVRDGDEFILLVRNKQANGFQAWSSSDQSTTSQLMKQAQQQLSTQPVTA